MLIEVEQLKVADQFTEAGYVKVGEAILGAPSKGTAQEADQDRWFGEYALLKPQQYAVLFKHLGLSQRKQPN